MLLQIFFAYIIGYLRVSVEGYYIERFINICRNSRITLWKLKRDKNVKIKMNIRISDFKDVIKIAKKTHCKVKIERKRGIPFLLNKYKKRKIFLGAIIIIVIGMMVLSNFIWNIEIIQEQGEELEGLYQDVENAGIKIGTLKSKIEPKNVINQIRLKRNDVAWMGIEFKGTNTIVRVVKAKEKPKIIDDNDFCNIVSDKEGVITKINAKNGTAAVKVGDTVKKGTVLINGWMEGKFTGLRYVHAIGDVEAKVWHTKNIFMPYNVTERRNTGVFENKYRIKINNFEINLSKRLSKFKIYDTIETEKKLRLFSDFYLPISLVKITNQEEIEEVKNYSLNDAKNIGIQRLEKEFSDEIEDETKIVNKNVNLYEKEDGIEIIYTYEVLENLGTNEKVLFQEEY